MAAALLALNSQRKQGGGHSNLVTCQAFLAQIAIFLGGLSWVDWVVPGKRLVVSGRGDSASRI
ncbi:hypothetical protein BJN34_0280 [Cupriavidus necator]|uniref:Uncharacterized protein n=1 Tax=Cupriavidus necator TaxID=106590 RepID=A0A2P1DV20_CUPNE|nr:hypothetical protein BJN34_0280 [Cupriavidus necator]